MLETDYGIPRRYLTGIMSPWAVKRLQEFGGDLSQFRVVRINPSVLRQVAITKTEPGDENNQDISSLVGKVDIRKLEHLSQNDPDAYSYSGGLCLANQGLLEFVEMFKAPIKMLHPLLTATQEGNFKGTEGFSAIPFNGLIVAHSNESEWHSFRNNKNNEAFLDRIYIVKVPYCVRVSEEVKIYQKLLANSSLAGAPCAPGTLEMMAQFSVLTRLKEPENSSIYSKMRVYDGETLKDVDPKAKTLQEYRDYAGPDEGMTGMSTRFAYKILSAVFNHDQTEIAANPVHLMYVLEQRLAREDLPDETRRRCIEHIKGYLAPRYAEFIGKEIQTAYLESYAEYGQNIFDRYVTFADCWIQEEDYRDPETGESFDRAALNSELEKIEKPAGIANPKDFRNEIVNFVLRARANNNGRNPAWSSYEKLREVIEKKMFSNTEDLLPVISFNAKASADEKREAPELRRAHGGQGLHREAGAPARGVVPARAQVVVTGPDDGPRPRRCSTSSTAGRTAAARARSIASASCAATRRRSRTRSRRWSASGASPTWSRAAKSACRGRTFPSRRSASAAAATANSCCRATANTSRAIASRGPKARAAAGRQRQRRRGRQRGRVRVLAVARRVHADLLRRPRAAQSRAHRVGPHRAQEEHPRGLHEGRRARATSPSSAR